MFPIVIRIANTGSGPQVANPSLLAVFDDGFREENAIVVACPALCKGQSVRRFVCNFFAVRCIY